MVNNGRVIALNAALALQVGEVVSFGDGVRGVAIALEIINSGIAWSKMEGGQIFRKLNIRISSILSY